MIKNSNQIVFQEKSRGRDLLLLLLGCLALWGWTYGGWDFWGPDEPRYVQIARELLGRSNWLQLTVFGEPYDQKPPLAYWMMAVLLKLNGGAVSSWVVRIPSLLFGVMIVALTYLVGRARLGRRAGWLGAWILLTSIMFIEEVPTARLDTLLAGWIMLAMWAWLGRPDDGPKLPPWRAALFWAALTGAFFIKGPVAWVIVLGTVAVEAWVAGTAGDRPSLRRFWQLIIAGGALINVAAFLDKLNFLSIPGWLFLGAALAVVIWRPRSWAVFGRLRPAWGLIFTVGAAVAWQAALRLTAPAAYSRHQLRTATMDRLVNPSMHLRWPGYYFEGLFGDGFPVWSVLLVLALWGLWRARRMPPPEWPALRPLLSWFLFPFILLTIVPTKREQYLLPMYPAMAILAGWWLDRHFEEESVPAWLRRAAAALAAGAGIFIIGMALFLMTGAGAGLFKFADEFALIKQAPLFGARVAGIALAGAVLIASAWAWPRAARVGRAAGILIATILFGAMIALGCGAPLLNQRKSTRPINAAIAAHLRRPDEAVGAMGTTRKAQNQVYSTHRLVDVESSASKLKETAATLPRIIIGEETNKKWKSAYGMLEDLGYRSVFRSSSALDHLHVLVRDK